MKKRISKNNIALIFWIIANLGFIVLIPTYLLAEKVSGESQEKQESSQSEAIYKDEGKRDPFVPIVTKDGVLTQISKDKKDTNFYLQGIFFDENGESVALINDQMLRKNDMIGDCKIISIKKDSVVYTKNGELFILSLFGEEGGQNVKK